MPGPGIFPYKHGRDVVKNRRAVLDRAQDELHRAQDWILSQKRILYEECVGHHYPSDPRDPGGGGGFCKDCGMANPRS